jgi:hypothetical protein
MARRTKDAPSRGTAKGGSVHSGRVTAPPASARYTPPLSDEYRTSPKWVLPLLLGLLAAGVLMIVLNYVSLLPGSASNWYLLGGLGLILVGFGVSTRLR